MKRFINATITKVDEATRMVEGVLVEEATDKDNEIFDYATSKPYFEKWNSDFSDRTQGKSVGNLRVMHGKEVAGRFVSMDYDDAQKQVVVAAKISNDAIWNQIIEGDYTGFSIGARYVKKWKDGSVMRWTADPFEGSVVDNPCMYGATFTKVGADGVKHAVKFTGRANKCLSCVATFACLLQDLNYLATSLEYETEYEGDGSPIAKEVRDVATTLGDLLVRYTREEVNEANGKEAVMSTKVKAEAGERPIAVAAKVDEPGERPVVVAAPESAAAAAAAPVEAAKAFNPDTASVEELEAHQAEIATKLAAKKAATATTSAKLDGGVEAAIKASFGELTGKVTQLLEEKLAAVKVEFDGRFEAMNNALSAMAEKTIPTPVNVKGVIVKKEGDGVKVTTEAPTTALEAIKLVQSQPAGRRAQQV